MAEETPSDLVALLEPSARQRYLEARTRIEALLPGFSNRTTPSVSADRTAAVAARQAYAVALLYLADVRPSAKAFYQSTARLQLILDVPSGEDFARNSDLVSSWREAFQAIESSLAEMADKATQGK